MAFEKGLGGHSAPIAKPSRVGHSGFLGKKVHVNKRWDITIGLAATGVAILGLISSIATSNREHLFGTVPVADQEVLLVLAATLGVLTALKCWLARRSQGN